MARWPKGSRKQAVNKEESYILSNKSMRKDLKIKKLKEKPSSIFKFYYIITRKYFELNVENSCLGE